MKLNNDLSLIKIEDINTQSFLEKFRFRKIILEDGKLNKEDEREFVSLLTEFTEI
jgi:hypothetical protein